MTLDGVLSLYAASSLLPPSQTWWILKRRNTQHLNRLRLYNNIVQTSGKDLVSELSDGHMLLKWYNNLIKEINSSMRLSVYNGELGVCHSKGINQHFNWIGHFTNWTNNINVSWIILPLQEIFSLPFIYDWGNKNPQIYEDAFLSYICLVAWIINSFSYNLLIILLFPRFWVSAQACKALQVSFNFKYYV